MYDGCGGKGHVYSSIECLAEAIWLSRYSRENFMGLLSSAYFDASGNKDLSFLAVAGAASPIKKWVRFETQWRAVLRDAGVNEFHATDFAASLGEYKDWKGDKVRRSTFLKRLIKVIRENTNRLFMVTIEIEAWRDVNKTYLLEETFHSPYALAGFSVSSQAWDWARRKRVPGSFKLFFEDGDEGWNGLKQLCQRYLNFEPIRLPKKEGIPFQIGDFIAWKSRIAATNSIGKLRALQAADYPNFDNFEGILNELKSLDSVLVRPGHRGIYGPEALERTCRKSKVPKRSHSVIL